MEFYNFTIPSIKIKSNWFEGEKQSIYHQIGKEEGLNLYLQLFRFRQHQITDDGQVNYNQHIFRVTIGELVKFTKVNTSKRLTQKQVVDLLIKMEKANVIKLLTPKRPKRWDALFDENGKVISDKLIILQATDVPNVKVEKNERGKDVEKPVTDDDWYIPINFNIINYIYNDLKLTSKELVVYLLMLKFSNSIERKAYININTIKKYLGFGNDTITKIIKTLNEHGLMVTYARRKGKKVNFEHYPLRSFNDLKGLERFKKETLNDRLKFLKRYNDYKDINNIDNDVNVINKENEPFDNEYYPFLDDFEDIDDFDIDGLDWGQSPQR